MELQPEENLVMTLASGEEVQIPMSECVVDFDEMSQQLKIVDVRNQKIPYDDLVVRKGTIYIGDVSKMKYFRSTVEESPVNKIVKARNITSVAFPNSGKLYGIAYKEDRLGRNKKQHTCLSKGRLWITFK